MQHGGKEGYCGTRYVSWCFVRTSSNLTIELLFIFFIKRKSSDKHAVETHTETPNIDFDSIVLDSVDNFRCGKTRTSAARFEAFAFREAVSKSEVYEFEVVLVVHQDVGWFDISMRNILGVKIGDR